MASPELLDEYRRVRELHSKYLRTAVEATVEFVAIPMQDRRSIDPMRNREVVEAEQQYLQALDEFDNPGWILDREQ